MKKGLSAHGLDSRLCLYDLLQCQRFTRRPAAIPISDFIPASIVVNNVGEERLT